MGGEEEQRPEAYREYVESAAREGLIQTPWDQLQAQVALRDEAFIRSLALKAHGVSTSNRVCGN